MKTISRGAATVALACLLSISALAGDMHTTVTGQQPPTGTSQTTQTNETISQPAEPTATPSDPVMEAMLAGLLALLAAL